MSYGQYTTSADVMDLLSADVARLEALLERTLDGLTSPSGLHQAYRHALFSGGKRVRPALALLSCEAVGGERSWGDAAGASVEMIHAFSLVHDDLPALDDDDMRRGKPTVHRAHGEAMAILAGDGLLTHAFTLLCNEGGGRGDAALAGTLCGELARATGKMIDGQVLDTLGGDTAPMPDEARLIAIHRNKTGALITGACRMGALAGMWGGVEESKLDSVTRYGNAMGLMFQAVDDLLDVESTPEALGKATQKDDDAGKLTYPRIFGLRETRRRISELRAESLSAIEPLGPAGEPLASLCLTMAERVS